MCVCLYIVCVCVCVCVCVVVVVVEAAVEIAGLKLTAEFTEHLCSVTGSVRVCAE